MQFSSAAGRQVVSTSTAETIGRVDEFVVDPTSHSVIAVTLKKTSGGVTLAWADITAFGVDAVTVSSADRLSEPSPEIAALATKDHRMLAKRTLSTTGDELGKVDDVEFDPATGVITALVLAGGEIAGVHLIGVGSYAVVVHHEHPTPGR